MRAIHYFTLIFLTFAASEASSRDQITFEDWRAVSDKDLMTDAMHEMIMTPSEPPLYIRKSDLHVDVFLNLSCGYSAVQIGMPGYPFYFDGTICPDEDAECYRYQKTLMRIDNRPAVEKALLTDANSNANNLFIPGLDVQTLNDASVIRFEIAGPGEYKIPEVISFSLDGFSEAYDWCQSRAIN